MLGMDRFPGGAIGVAGGSPSYGSDLIVISDTSGLTGLGLLREHPTEEGSMLTTDDWFGKSSCVGGNCSGGIVEDIGEDGSKVSAAEVERFCAEERNKLAKMGKGSALRGGQLALNGRGEASWPG